jgi:hypothetical protein
MRLRERDLPASAPSTVITASDRDSLDRELSGLD